MSYLSAKTPPKTEEELMERCESLAGITFSQLAYSLGLIIPSNPLQRKGWVGQAIELVLGTTANNLSLPDFQHLGIELKTLPLSNNGKPSESTFICSIPLLQIQKQTWETSPCFAKLKKILWVPVEGDTTIPFENRRIGLAFLWSPDNQQMQLLKEDWTMLTDLIILGKLGDLDARKGEYLQVRPKAANGKSLCDAYDEEGNKIKTLPRGFYLRSRFTESLL